LRTIVGPAWMQRCVTGRVQVATAPPAELQDVHSQQDAAVVQPPGPRREGGKLGAATGLPRAPQPAEAAAGACIRIQVYQMS